MSFHTFFMLTTGLSKPMQVPIGTKASIIAHVEEVERVLGLKRTQYLTNPVHWDHFDAAFRNGFPDVDDKTLCETVENHNVWVRRLYSDMGEWSSNPPTDGETITPEDASEFWHGLQQLEVHPHRWTADYYRARMETLYEVMRGRPTDGISFDTKALTVKQAAAVIRIFDQYLDPGDMRLDVPDGYDYLASFDDGGYDWCDTCFKPIHPDCVWECKRRKCSLKEEN